MFSGILTVGHQVLILFFMIMTGFVCTKRNFFTEDCISGIAKFVLYTVTPCVIINSFHREFNAEMLKNLGIACAASFFVHGAGILFSRLLIHDKDYSRECVLRFGVTFANCGYMALPLQQSLLGDDGVFYGATCVAVYNIVNWTYGLFLMGGKESRISVKKIFLSPGIIGVGLGLVFFLTPLTIPSIPLTAIRSFAALNTPLPMVIIGYYLAGITTLKVLKDKKLVLAIVLRLIVVPLFSILAFKLFGLTGIVLCSVVIAASAPCAANTVMFSVMYKRDNKLAVTMVAVATLFAIFTMPMIVSIVM